MSYVDFNPKPPLSVSHTAVLRPYISGVPTPIVAGAGLLYRGCFQDVQYVQDAWHTQISGCLFSRRPYSTRKLWIVNERNNPPDLIQGIYGPPRSEVRVVQAVCAMR